ncbi:hypothetical protein [Reinekea sp. G2M2-21]|uniref:hypothetical protein n=1 Tax=Reinekea sp. G2M2-21 TaxID=2788942 RepID=UPI0018ABEBD3|nr:hypothetical protein [Reinekea sp. G2M2-21]
MALDNSAWLELSKEQIQARKQEWQCIKKSLKETELLFRGKPYLSVHKKLFMTGAIPEGIEQQIQKGRPEGEENFGHAFVFYYLWYHPSTDPKVLNDLLFEIQWSGIGDAVAKSPLNQNIANPARLCPDYGYLGPKAELLTYLFNRVLWPNKFIRGGVEYEFRAHPKAVMLAVSFLGKQIGFKKYAGYSFSNFAAMFSCPRFVSEAYLYRLANAGDPEINRDGHLKAGYTAALEFYKTRNEYTKIKANRFIRYRMLEGWLNKTYAPELLAFIDNIASEIGYEPAWEALAAEYDDQFVVPTFDID